jgi:N-acetylglucosaminyldiphosphoundecaprenol N-acetyl-beta-D-mannosaminyltransferase
MDLRTLPELVEQALACVDDGKRRLALAFVNPHSLAVARRDLEFIDALDAMDAVVADGIGCRLGAHLAGVRVGPRVTGHDFFTAFMRALDRRGGRRAFFLGSTEPVLELIRQRCRVDHPGVEIGVHSPPFGAWSPDEDERLLELVADFSPDVLWVGMTAPRQEKWYAAMRHRLRVPVVGCIGAVFDYYAGTVRRAPPMVRRAGLEWLYRLAGEPRRLWKRTLVSAPQFIWSATLQRFEGAGRARHAGPAGSRGPDAGL